MSSYELFCALLEGEGDLTLRDPYWWPSSGSFEVIVGVMLTQQTKWENVEKSLANLKYCNILGLNELSDAGVALIAEAIKPSGFYNQKSVRLKALCKAICEEFGDFESFSSGVDRDWLLAQKGVGKESADSILLYACRREIMVVDSYTVRLLAAKCDMEGLEYDEIREWLEDGLYANEEQARVKAGGDMVKAFSLYHGAIVEYCKRRSKKGSVGGYIQNVC